MYIKSEKQNSTLNQFVSNRKPSETQTQQLRLGNMLRCLYQFLQTLWRNKCSSATLTLITSLHLLLKLWKIRLPKAKPKWKTCSLISRQQWRLNWAASSRNLPIAIIDERARGFTWVKMIVITKVVPQLNSCGYKRINWLISKNLGNGIAMFYMSLVSTVQNTISN